MFQSALMVTCYLILLHIDAWMCFNKILFVVYIPSLVIASLSKTFILVYTISRKDTHTYIAAALNSLKNILWDKYFVDLFDHRKKVDYLHQVIHVRNQGMLRKTPAFITHVS